MTKGLFSEITFTAVDFDPFENGELVSVVPATASQQEIWLSVQMGNDANCAYNESQSLRLRGSLDVDALRFALQQLVERHQALRIAFSPDGANLCIALSLKILVPLVDISNLSDQDRHTQLIQLRRKEVKQPFDLVNGPLFRAQIIKCSTQEHLVIITAHHIVCDGWSWSVLLPDLAIFYSAALHNTAANIEMPECFSKYALLQQELIQSPEYAAGEQYWLKQFSDSIPVLDLPLTRPRPALKSYNADREDWEVNSSLVANIKRVGAKAGCSLFTIILAGFEVFLHRLTQQADIVVGIPSAGQSFGGQAGLVGHCVNFLPMRSHVDAGQTFIDYLQMRSSEILDAYEHQQITFGSLIEKLAIPRDPSRVPLVSVAFNYDRAIAGSELQFDGLNVDIFSNPRSFENFELFINASETSGKLVLECQYNTDLFDAESIRRRLEEFEVLLSGIVADSHQPIWKLPILSQDEQQLLLKWNETRADYPIGKCIHHLFEAQVERNPESIAVVFEDRHLTYRELNAQANQLAHHLQALGVEPEVLVGICVERSLEMVVGLLAILKAGGAYVPLDPSHPSDRIAYVLQDTCTPILLTQQSLVEALPTHTQVICLDADRAIVSQGCEENPAIAITSDNLAYVLYTSGSTGLPKGVQIEHRSVVNLLNSVSIQPGLTQQDTLLSVTTITFDISVAEIFLPLTVGAKLLVASREVACDGIKLLETLKTSGATFVQPTPVTWQLLLAAGWTGSHQLKMISTGEALTRELANQLLLKGAVWNLYGPTETTIWSATHSVEPGNGLIPIGRPLANTQFYILDSYLQPVPLGVLGELYIGGDGLARGYLNRPELTAEKFIPNPFSQEPEARLYRTGDLVRYRADGNVECLGRIDYQVKIRGFRIELGEIEAALNQHSAVQEVVVVAREDTPGNKRLVAYVVLHPHQTIAVSDMRNFISRKLPDYMLPSAFVLLEKLPLTTSGKVDRRSLPVPQQERPALESVATQDILELQLTNIWEQILSIQPISITDNFFELGGNSLLAVRLFAQIQKIFGKALPLPTLFQSPTIEQLAKILRSQGFSAPVQSLVPLKLGGGKPPLFCIRGILHYHNLARHLDLEQPVYGVFLQAEVDLLLAGKLEVELSTLTSVTELATQYIKEIQTLQPNGPYFLAGESFGGLVAFEMAQQLHVRGEKVAMLALFDTEAPGVIKKLSWRERVFIHLDNLAEEGSSYVLKKVQRNIDASCNWLASIISGIHRNFNQLCGLPLPDYLQEVTQTDVRNQVVTQARGNYVPQPYPGKVILFRALERDQFDSYYTDTQLGWGELSVGGLEVHHVPGDHLSMLQDPHVQVLAGRLTDCLDQAQANNVDWLEKHLG